MSERHSKPGCPRTRELELFCLGELAVVRTRDFITAHLNTCPRCTRKVRNLRAFYAIFSRELEQPITPGLLDYCKKRAYKSVKYGLLVCRPIPEKDKQKGKAYLATLAFSANGDGSKTSLVDFDLSGDQIGVMLYSDPLQNQILMFLWSHSEDETGPSRLYAPGLFEKAEFNLSGAAKIPLTNFEYLDNRLVYFSMSKKPRSRQNVLAKVQDMLI
jgi:hypothetical protein